jgi:hypothetical protein
MFKVGDRVRVLVDCDIYYSAGDVGVISYIDNRFSSPEYHINFDESRTVYNCPPTGRLWWVCTPMHLELEAKVAEPTARSNDPATSKGKRKVNKYEEEVLDCLRVDKIALEDSFVGAGLTGKEIAARHGYQLNCITPRFAPLRRKGLIKDSGKRRDKQIVWVLA